jgi:hypothetical protein
MCLGRRLRRVRLNSIEPMLANPIAERSADLFQQGFCRGGMANTGGLSGAVSGSVLAIHINGSPVHPENRDSVSGIG